MFVPTPKFARGPATGMEPDGTLSIKPRITHSDQGKWSSDVASTRRLLTGQAGNQGEMLKSFGRATFTRMAPLGVWYWLQCRGDLF